MLKKSFIGVVIPEMAEARFGSLKEGVHLVVICDAIYAEQNQDLDLADETARLVKGATKLITKAHPAFNQDITAVFVTADICAIGIMEGARLGGLKIPNDLSIMGFDNLILRAEFLKC